MEPIHRQYLIRLFAGMVSYVILLFVAVWITPMVPQPWTVAVALIFAPAIFLLVRAVAKLWGDSDEFGRAQMQEAAALGFAIAVPTVLALALLEIITGVRFTLFSAFGIAMAAWAGAAAWCARKYR